MIAGDRLPLITFGLSLLLHLLVVLSMQHWTWLQPRAETPSRTQYVARFQTATPTPAPVAPPVAPPDPAPITPVEIAPTPPPQTPQVIERRQIEPDPTPITEVSPTPVKPLEEVPDEAIPQKPQVIERRQIDPAPKTITKVAPTLVKPLEKTRAARPRRPVTPKKRPPKPAAPRRLARPSPTLTKPPTPRPAPSPPPQLTAAPAPRQPSSNWQPPAPAPPRAGEAEADALQAYLHLVYQVLEKNKRYPKYARRRAMNGSVVLQFVILADGRVMNPQIAKSDGHQLFQQAALRALDRAGQMPPFPNSIRRSRLLVEAPISYQIKNR